MQTLSNAKNLWLYNGIVADGYKVTDGRVSKLTKSDKIKQYNHLFEGFNITNIKTMTTQQIEGSIRYGAKSLDDLYKSCSDTKRDSYNEILETYKPKAILSVQGNNNFYSVLLVAWNGDKLFITRDNNYLVEEVK